MIKKIISIKNVGRFLNYGSNGDMELHRYNLFFAENGRGKTTICAILRSLNTAKPEYILERKTLGATGNPQVKLLLENKEIVTFDGTAWNKSYPAIEIFDSAFINANIFVGDYVDLEQKRNLYRVIIGSEGVALAAEVDYLDETIRTKNTEIASRKAAVQQQTPRSVKTIEAFLAIAADSDIDAKITDKTKELQSAKRAGEIKARGLLSNLACPIVPLKLQAILLKGIEGIGKDAEERVAKQTQAHKMHDEGQKWLSSGIGYIQGDICPFCGQGLTGNALIAAYRAFFSDAYHQLRDQIGVLKKDIETAFGQKSFSDIEKAITHNDVGIDFWKQFLPIELPAIAFDNDIRKPLQEFTDATLALVAKKTASPLEEIKPDDGYELKETSAQTALAKLAAYDKAITAANTAIQEKKVKAQALNEATVEAALEQLKAIKHKYLPEVSMLCYQYQASLDEKKTLEAQKTTAKGKLDKHTNTIITHYDKRINDLLKGFGAGFSIANIKRTYPGGTPSSTYEILINDTPIEIGDSTTPLGTPCFRNTLSAGDKNTLAFVFFLAQLERDEQKAQKVVVFDDPFNSQDRSRRTRTKDLIKK